MSEFISYPKIYGPYKRYVEGKDKNKLIIGEWSRPEFEATKDLQWVFTEKVDGSSIQVRWDGHRVQFGGRTDNSQMPVKLVTKLTELFPEELFEQAFGETEVILFGEGYGKSIQKVGAKYKVDGVDFVLFDVLIGRFWLLREDVENIAGKMGIDVVPVIYEGTVADGIRIVSGGLTSQWHGDGTFCNHGLSPCTVSVANEFMAEGLVGVTKAGLLARDGRRIQMKIKTCDFLEI